ncbi:MAG: undecaprenyldiphospho-muramoylpentapeptide beta-N-acetylglucosaminyltransferase [Pseudomonadota bacterium]
MKRPGRSPVLILAGGTGGHVYPALAIAQWLMRMNVPVVWMGTRAGLEARIVPEAGIVIDWLSISGLRGKGMLAWVLAPWRLNLAIAQALRIMLRYRPCVVLGMGGFVAGPGGVAAFLLSKPLVVHEQNAIAGLTNRLLSPLCDRLLEGFPGSFKSAKARHVGNPVRQEISSLPDPRQRFAHRQGSLHLLVLGGSLGAQALNEIVPQAVSRLPEQSRPRLWHQAGNRNITEAQARYEKFKLKARVEAYIEDMACAYAWADLVLCRAGALTVAELCAAGVGAVLVPYPYAVDDHQRANARFMVETGAGILVTQSELTVNRLLRCLRLERSRLLEMAIAARGLAKADAAEVVARISLDAAQHKGRSAEQDERP